MVSKKMKTAIMTDIGKMEIVEQNIPEPEEDEVLIRIRAVGVCGSDVHLFKNGSIGKFKVTLPYCLGHEPAGEVVATGKKVTHLQEGDRIVMEPGVPCGRCLYCKTGHYNLCRKLKFLAEPPVSGVLCEYATHKADFCYKINDSVSFPVATLAEPLSVGVYACRRAGVEPGKRIAILGMGPIGQMTLIAARSFGARNIAVCDIIDSRLQFAEMNGAQATFNSGHSGYQENVAHYTNREGFDIVIDAAGAVQTALYAVEICKNGGTIIMIGSTVKPEINFPILKILQKELSLLGSYRYTNTYPLVLDILTSEKDLFEKLITHSFQLAQTQEAFNFAYDKKSESMKTIITL